GDLQIGGRLAPERRAGGEQGRGGEHLVEREKGAVAMRAASQMRLAVLGEIALAIAGIFAGAMNRPGVDERERLARRLQLAAHILERVPIPADWYPAIDQGELASELECTKGALAGQLAIDETFHRPVPAGEADRVFQRKPRGLEVELQRRARA